MAGRKDIDEKKLKALLAQRKAELEALIPAVQAFAEGRVELPEPTPLPVASL